MEALAFAAQFARGLHCNDPMAATCQRGSIPAGTRADVEYRSRRRREQVNQVAVNFGESDAFVLGGQGGGVRAIAGCSGDLSRHVLKTYWINRH